MPSDRNPARWRIAPPGRLIEIGAHRLHLWCQGNGTPSVIFDAALGGSSVSWTLVAPRVAAVTGACTYDRAGFGWSDGGPLPRTAGRIASELHELLRRAGVPAPWLLVGHSYGALVVQLLAARHPGTVAGLVLLEPAHPEDWTHPTAAQQSDIARGARLCGYGAQAARLGVGTAVAGLVGAGALGVARVIVKVVSRGGLERADEGILAPVWKLPSDSRRVLKQAWTRPAFFEALGSQIETIGESAREAMQEVPDSYGDLPLLVVTGSRAADVRLRADRALANRSHRGRHVIAPDSGHWVPLDAPDAVVRAVLDVVQEIREIREIQSSPRSA